MLVMALDAPGWCLYPDSQLHSQRRCSGVSSCCLVAATSLQMLCGATGPPLLTHLQVSFAWSGFNNAMISNVGMVLRNIYSKKFLGQLKVRSFFAFNSPTAMVGLQQRSGAGSMASRRHASRPDLSSASRRAIHKQV